MSVDSDPQQAQRFICIVRGVLDLDFCAGMLDRVELGERNFTLLDHLEDRAHSHLAAFERCLVSLDLQRLVDRKLALNPALGDFERLVEDFLVSIRCRSRGLQPVSKGPAI